MLIGHLFTNDQTLLFQAHCLTGELMDKFSEIPWLQSVSKISVRTAILAEHLQSVCKIARQHWLTAFDVLFRAV